MRTYVVVCFCIVGVLLAAWLRAYVPDGGAIEAAIVSLTIIGVAALVAEVWGRPHEFFRGPQRGNVPTPPAWQPPGPRQ